MRVRGEELAKKRAQFDHAYAEAGKRDVILKKGLGPLYAPNEVATMKFHHELENSTFSAQVEELNERFRRAQAPLTYHNGFIQLSIDQEIEKQIATPFWHLVSDPKWKNVDIDMKEALDRRDSNVKDPAFFAAKALESAIKIISDIKGWSRNSETGVAQYIDNLVSKANGHFLSVWEGDMLKDYFRKVRNSVGHGPGTEPMPELTLPQTDWAIETAMSWVRTLVRRIS